MNGSSGLGNVLPPFLEHDFCTLIGHDRSHDMRGWRYRTLIFELHVVVVHQVSKEDLYLHGCEKSPRTASNNTSVALVEDLKY